LNGVHENRALLEKAVKLTDSAVFHCPLLRKLETLPLDRCDRNIPKAPSGGCITREAQVKNGVEINWENKPKKRIWDF